MKFRTLGRDLLAGQTGKNNSITDVRGIKVGHAQVWTDHPFVQRTGATVILPHEGNVFEEGVFAHTEVMNGFGILTGRDSVNELGLLASPIVLTNTRSIGTGYESVMRYFLDYAQIDYDLPLPVVGECDDSYLNDSRGPPVPLETFQAAFKSASDGPVDEGAVGGGTGMELFDFKGGIGTSSRIVEIQGTEYSVGVLVNANYGSRHQLSVLGRRIFETSAGEAKDGSCIGVLATDAPISSEMLSRLSKRMGFGLARTGSVANNSSGDIFISFSTGRKITMEPYSIDSGRLKEQEIKRTSTNFLSNGAINPLFEAAVSATEEAALNALFQAKTTKGYGGHVLEGFSETGYSDELGLF